MLNTRGVHVVDQLAVIHEELNITVPDDYFESQSTRELKHDLAYHLTGQSAAIS